jgi:RNA polymerase sigma factor (sigma-70 family)
MASNSAPTQDSPTLESSPAAQRRLLEQLARRYYAPLLRFFRKRYPDESEVQDLAQQVFLHLAQSRELAHIRNPDRYIFRTASNILKDHHRQQMVRRTHADRSHGLCCTDDTDFSAEQILVGREAVARLTQALWQLSERTRDIVVLRCFEGLKHAEIARLHSISVRAVEKQIVKALTHLTAALDLGTGGAP